MIETELKITLNAAEAARLRRHPALAALREGPRRSARLVSVYCDTADHALARAGIALRLRRVGRRWVQTVKRARTAGGAGLYAQEEIERPAPGGRLALDGPDPAGVYAAIAEAAGEAPLAPVFETRVARASERLRLPAGLVELALDRGEVVAGEARAPILEAELELVEGELAAVFDLARRLFPSGPVTFAAANKSALGYRLAREGAAVGEVAPRTAGALAYGPEATVETVARDVFRDCFAQIAQNAVVAARSDAVEGPHQLRVGLRRLRTVLAIFAPSLGEAAVAPLSARARDLGRAVGRLRDADVLIVDVTEEAAGFGLDAAARGALAGVLAARREAVRAEVRAALAGPEATAFLFDLLEFIEGRGWLAPADYSQTARLATPIGELAPALLGKRHRRALKRGRRIATLEAEALHELRKELKKLRYAVETLAPLYSPKKVGPYLKALKEMQDTFGSLNDAAMAAEALAGPEAPATDDPAAQRAIGWTLGTLAIRVRDDRPKLDRRWREFEEARPFWT
jgi:inorganic triphosphatase YgiF